MNHGPRCGPQPGAGGALRRRAVAAGAGSDQLGYVEVGECQFELGYFSDLQAGLGGAPRAPDLRSMIIDIPTQPGKSRHIGSTSSRQNAMPSSTDSGRPRIVVERACTIPLLRIGAAPRRRRRLVHRAPVGRRPQVPISGLIFRAESTARITWACAATNCRQVGAGALPGSIRADLRTSVWWRRPPSVGFAATWV